MHTNPNNYSTQLKRIQAFFQSLRESEAAMRIATLIISFIITLVIISSCDNSPTGPEEPPPGRRDYKVEIDTVEPSTIYFYDIWGQQPNNIWAIASGSIPSHQTIWHYNGEKWQLEENTPWISGNSIFGFSESDIWIAGDGGRILHYDGTQWKHAYQYGDPEWNPNNFLDIWGPSPDDLYAVGHTHSSNVSYGLILHYDGNEWKKIDIPDIKAQFWKIRSSKSSASKLYLIGTNGDLIPPDSSRIFEFKSNNLKEIYLGKLFTDEQSNMEVINGRVYFGFNKKIHERQNNQFIVKENIDHPQTGNSFYGRNLHDLILPTIGGITHYNGSDVQYLYQDQNFFGLSYLVLENTFFATGYDFNNNVNLFVRGKLENK